ncbi:kinase-like domain-containing protein, partial [Entophlyctis helioformis]
DGTTADKTVTRRASFVGTAEYCSPELLNDREASTASDVWAIGCILYQLLVGRPPFKGSNEYQTFQRIIHLKYAFPAHDDTVDGGTVGGWKLVETILNLDPAQRPTLDAVKEHAFFAGLVWDGLERQTPPS